MNKNFIFGCLFIIMAVLQAKNPNLTSGIAQIFEPESIRKFSKIAVPGEILFGASFLIRDFAAELPGMVADGIGLAGVLIILIAALLLKKKPKKKAKSKAPLKRRRH